MASYVITFVNLLLNILSFAIFARILLSWVDQMGNWQITGIVRDLTEPILAPIRSILPQMSMFDLSPVIAMLLLNALRQILVTALR
ncbi:MAG: YggT family protein [Roseiflexaceae bacterium]|nr:YggT family protein [Roseiflexaceae bacterium]